MKKSALFILLAVALVFCFRAVGATPVLIVTDPVVFPCESIDEDGYAEDADSAHVHVWHEDAGDNAITYSARTDDMTADWIGEVAYAGGKNLTMFRDVAGDIDAGAGDGNYTMRVDLFVDGQRFPTYYNFYLSATNTNTAQDGTAAIKVQTDLLDFDANDSLVIERANQLAAVNTTEWAGTAAGTADNGWVTATGFAEATDIDSVEIMLTRMRDTLNAAHVGAGAIQAVTDLFQFTATNFVQSDIQYIDATEAAATNLEKVFDGDTTTLAKITSNQFFIRAQGTNDAAIFAMGNGTGEGMNLGGGASGSGAYFHAGGANKNGLYVLGEGTGSGFGVYGGSDGSGAKFVAGGGNNHGIGLYRAGTGKDLYADIDSAAFGDDYYDATRAYAAAVLESLIAHAPHGDDWASAGAGDSNTTAGVELGCRQAIVTYKLDHLLYAADGDDPVNNSVIALLAAIGGDWSTFDKTTESLEALRNRGDAAWTGSAGEDATPIYMYAVDTLNDVRVDGVTITMFKAGSSLGSSTTSDDTASFNGQDGVDYTFSAFAPSFIWEPSKAVKCATPSNTDSTMGYPFVPTTSVSSQEQTGLWDWAWGPDGDTLAYAKVTIKLSGGDMFTSSVTVVPATIITFADSDGYWTRTIYGTDSTFNAKSYTVMVEHADLEAPIKYEDLEIPANGSTTWLRTLLTKSGQ